MYMQNFIFKKWNNGRMEAVVSSYTHENSARLQSRRQVSGAEAISAAQGGPECNDTISRLENIPKWCVQPDTIET